MEIKIDEPWITDKVRIQNGYAYIDHPFWNAEKQQADHKREYIGKYDGTNFKPNKNFHRLKAEYETSLTASKTGPVPADICLRQFHGATYLLDRIAEKTGIAADLGKCYGSLAPQILSIAYYLIVEEGLPLYRFTKWGSTHRHPYGKDIPSQRSSELFGLITEESKMDYFKYQAKRHSYNEYLAFDTTSISSYSTLIKQAKYGKNKEGDSLPQINLALLYGEESMLPVYYRKLAGNITDVKTIENLVKDVDFLKLEKLKLDRLENNLVNGTPDPEDAKLYQKYFTIHETPVRGKVYSFNEDAIRKAERNYGYFALMTNGIKDPIEALHIYRLKDLIEKSFGNLKERLSMRRMSVASA